MNMKKKKWGKGTGVYNIQSERNVLHNRAGGVEVGGSNCKFIKLAFQMLFEVPMVVRLIEMYNVVI